MHRFVIFVLALALLAPLAVADHAYSHRVYVVGRVVDANDVPVPGRSVEVSFVGIEEGGRCLDSGDERTGPQGDFVVCRHMHVIPRGVTARVTVADATFEAELDRDVRQATFHILLSEAAPPYDLTGWRKFNETFHVEGRVFEAQPAPVEVEGVPVPATIRPGENVTVTLEHEGVELARGEAVVDAMGLYEVDLDVGELPEGTTVRVEATGGVRSAPVDATFRRADVHHVLGVAQDESALISRPGTTDMPAPWWVAVAALILGVATIRPRR